MAFNKRGPTKAPSFPYARGKHARAISDRSGLEYPYLEMVREWNGLLVHTSEYEPKQPQLDPIVFSDPEALKMPDLRLLFQLQEAYLINYQ